MKKMILPPRMGPRPAGAAMGGKLFLTARLLPFLLIVALLLPACASAPPPESSAPASSEPAPAESAPARKLVLSSEADYGTHASLSQEYLGSYAGEVLIRNRKNLSIELDGQPYLLEDALARGLVSMEEIVAWAKVDARNGYCEELHESVKGLTTRIFRFQDLDMQVVDDIYETPGGEQRHIQRITFDMLGALRLDHSVPDIRDENGFPIDREDWGISISGQVTGSGADLTITQSGGQQLGPLGILYYTVAIDGARQYDLVFPDGAQGIPLTMEGTSAIHLDFEKDFGPIPSGSHILRIWIKDFIDPDSVHPLMRDYHDEQRYELPFSIPSGESAAGPENE